MGATIHIKQALKAKGKTGKEYAEEHGIPYQTLRNKLSRDSMTFEAVEEIADNLGCDVVLIDKKELHNKRKTIKKDKIY